jgi:hypothetical protein
LPPTVKRDESLLSLLLWRREPEREEAAAPRKEPKIFFDL